MTPEHALDPGSNEDFASYTISWTSNNYINTGYTSCTNNPNCQYALAEHVTFYTTPNLGSDDLYCDGVD
jgi:hypothetical protein